ncbi:MAG: cell division protein ZapD [Rhodoferax sp.]|nr:cell division protein ZapD [Rhodoferax sp.]
MILYEYPFHERIRTYLRLEHLFIRLSHLASRDDAIDHHCALATMFEIIEVAARSDLRSDLLKDLDRQKSLLEAYRDNPAISQPALEQVIAQLDRCHEAMTGQTGKAGQGLADNEWLTALRNRIAIPGGTCEFDLPAYHAWKHLPGERRRQDLATWIGTLLPMADSIRLLLKLLRDAGTPQKVIANGGQFQQNLPQGRTFQMLRLALDPALGLIPEISGNRLAVSIRLMRQTDEGRWVPSTDDTAFEMALCL